MKPQHRPYWRTLPVDIKKDANSNLVVNWNYNGRKWKKYNDLRT